MTEVTDSVGSDDEGGEVFMVLSGKLLTVDSGDQPLCRFLGGPEFEWDAIVRQLHFKIYIFLSFTFLLI